MAEATLSQLKTRLNIKVRDGSNVSFTDAEKTDALTTAINDSFVTSIQRDATTTTTSADNYTVPDGTLLKLGIRLNTTGKPADVSGWSVYDQVVYLDEVLPTGKTLVMILSVKLTKDDPIPDNRQEYVLVLAAIELVKMLKESLSNTFLTNDMTMGDLEAKQQSLMRDAARWRQSFITTQVIEL